MRAQVLTEYILFITLVQGQIRKNTDFMQRQAEYWNMLFIKRCVTFAVNEQG